MEKIKLVVFIDDDSATNFYHKIVVRESGLVEEVRFFSEPESALEFFENLAYQPNPIVPDAIFLDINMPRMDGWEFLEAYAQISVEKSPIIIMLSTSLNPDDATRAKENPLVKCFRNKPLEEQHLIELKKDLAAIR